MVWQHGVAPQSGPWWLMGGRLGGHLRHFLPGAARSPAPATCWTLSTDVSRKRWPTLIQSPAPKTFLDATNHRGVRAVRSAVRLGTNSRPSLGVADRAAGAGRPAPPTSSGTPPISTIDRRERCGDLLTTGGRRVTAGHDRRARAEPARPPTGTMDPGRSPARHKQRRGPREKRVPGTNCTTNPCRWGDYSGASSRSASTRGVVWGSQPAHGHSILRLRAVDDPELCDHHRCFRRTRLRPCGVTLGARRSSWAAQPRTPSTSAGPEDSPGAVALTSSGGAGRSVRDLQPQLYEQRHLPRSTVTTLGRHAPGHVRHPRSPARLDR